MKLSSALQSSGRIIMLMITRHDLPALPTPQVYGTHLMLRLGGIQRDDILDDPASLKSFLVELVHAIGMRVMAGPMGETEHNDPEHYGHSAIVLLYESHAAVHTYPKLRSMFFDVFSCKPFAAADVIAFMTNTFGSFEIVESNVLDRGIHWTADAHAALEEWRTVR